VICATVLIQGLSAGIVAKILGLQRPAPNDWVIIGAHHFGRELARKLMGQDEQCILLLDTNARNIALARKEGLPALNCDGMEAEKLYEEEQALFGAGYILALTDNIELNQLLMQRWGDVLDNEKVFGWIPLDAPTSEDQLTGQSVFRNLSRPAVIGSELLQGESSFEVVTWETAKSLASGDWHPLFIRRGKQLRAIPQDASWKEMVKAGDEVICLRRSEGFLMRALQSGGFTRFECSTPESLYQQLAQIASEHVDTLKPAEILEDLREQGRVFPAFLGHGIAIPNIYCKGLDYRICFFAHLEEGLAIAGQEEAIDTLFFIISPEGDTEGHLATLAEIARTCRNNSLREQIKRAESAEDVVTAISN
jgi:mannitol/fructose-specific phosphotransferase system IIA component (Ntr-type)